MFRVFISTVKMVSLNRQLLSQTFNFVANLLKNLLGYLFCLLVDSSLIFKTSKTLKVHKIWHSETHSQMMYKDLNFNFLLCTSSKRQAVNTSISTRCSSFMHMRAHSINQATESHYMGINIQKNKHYIFILCGIVKQSRKNGE